MLQRLVSAPSQMTDGVGGQEDFHMSDFPIMGSLIETTLEGELMKCYDGEERSMPAILKRFAAVAILLAITVFLLTMSGGTYTHG
jgi:hypothetical protein